MACVQTQDLRQGVSRPSGGETVADEPLGQVDVSLEQLGVEVPAVPGDVGLCGALRKEDVMELAKRYKAWLYLNTADNPALFRAEIEGAGAKLAVTPFPRLPLVPSSEQAEAILSAIDTLPRPLMVQCTSGMRAGATLLLWLGKKRGYTGESVKQLAVDADFKVFTKCMTCGPVREWLMEQLPETSASLQAPGEPLIFRQLFDPESSTFTYLLACQATKEAVLIDPVLEQKERDLVILRELGLQLRYVLDTHAHADHISAGGAIRKEVPSVQTIMSRASGAKADILLEPGDTVAFGEYSLEAIDTPGHTSGCMSWSLSGAPGRVFTGDALLIRGCGRTDFQEGDAGVLFDNVHSKLFALPGETLVYPAHDYKGRNVSTIDEERRFNPRLTKTKDEFVAIMDNLGLPYPKKIDVAVPANMAGV